MIIWSVLQLFPSPDTFRCTRGLIFIDKPLKCALPWLFRYFFCGTAALLVLNIATDRSLFNFVLWMLGNPLLPFLFGYLFFLSQYPKECWCWALSNIPSGQEFPTEPLLYIYIIPSQITLLLSERCFVFALTSHNLRIIWGKKRKQKEGKAQDKSRWGRKVRCEL